MFANALVREYAFTNELKMMGHVWRRDGELVIAAKGSPERILMICELTDAQRNAAEAEIRTLSAQGLRSSPLRAPIRKTNPPSPLPSPTAA